MLEAERGIGQVINTGALLSLHALRNKFENAEPFRHVVIDDFLVAGFASDLAANFPAVADPSKLLNEFGVPNPKAAVSDVRSLGPVYKAFDSFLASPAFLGLIEKTTGIGDLRWDPMYFGGGTHENFHGAELDLHVDFNFHPTNGMHRRLNLIIYLNAGWDPAWGGQLCLHADPYSARSSAAVEVDPVFNRCVIFETNERSWHSVRPVNLPTDRRASGRRSFTVYFYTPDRPAEELGPRHDTLYVQEGLPAALIPGHVLSHDDCDRLERNFARRNAYLKALYSRANETSDEIRRLKDMLGEARRRTTLPLLGMAKLRACRVPLYPDGWMGEAADFEVELIEPCSRIELRAFRPDRSLIGATIRMEADGEAASCLVEDVEILLELKFREPRAGALNVKLTADRTIRVPGADERELSMMPTAIRFHS